MKKIIVFSLSLFTAICVVSFAGHAQSIGNLTENSPAGKIVRHQNFPVMRFQITGVPTQSGNVYKILEKVFIGIQTNRKVTGSIDIGLYNYYTGEFYGNESLVPIRTHSSGTDSCYVESFITHKQNGSNLLLDPSTVFEMRANLNSDSMRINDVITFIVNGIEYRDPSLPNEPSFLFGNTLRKVTLVYSGAIISNEFVVTDKIFTVDADNSLNGAYLLVGDSLDQNIPYQEIGRFTVNNWHPSNEWRSKYIVFAETNLNTFPGFSQNFFKATIEKLNSDGKTWTRITPEVQNPNRSFNINNNALNLQPLKSAVCRLMVKSVNWTGFNGSLINFTASVMGMYYLLGTITGEAGSDYDTLQTIVVSDAGNQEYYIHPLLKNSLHIVSKETIDTTMTIVVHGAPEEDTKTEEIRFEVSNPHNITKIGVTWNEGTAKKSKETNVTNSDAIISGIGNFIGKNASENMQVKITANRSSILPTHDPAQKISVVSISHLISKGEISKISRRGDQQKIRYTYSQFGSIPEGTFLHLNRPTIGSYGFKTVSSINGTVQINQKDEFEIMVPATEVSRGYAFVEMKRGDVVDIYDPNVHEYGRVVVLQDLSAGTTTDSLVLSARVGVSPYRLCYIVNITKQTNIAAKPFVFEDARLDFTVLDPINNGNAIDASGETNQILLTVRVKCVGEAPIKITSMPFIKTSSHTSAIERIKEFTLVRDNGQTFDAIRTDKEVIEFRPDTAITLAPGQSFAVQVQGNTSDIGKAFRTGTFQLQIGRSSGPFGEGGWDWEYVSKYDNQTIVRGNTANDYPVQGPLFLYGGSGKDLSFCSNVKINFFPHPVTRNWLAEHRAIPAKFVAKYPEKYEGIRVKAYDLQMRDITYMFEANMFNLDFSAIEPTNEGYVIKDVFTLKIKDPRSMDHVASQILFIVFDEGCQNTAKLVIRK